MSNFLIWSTDFEPHFCTVTGIRNVSDSHELKRGISRIRGFPADAYFEMDPDRRKAVKLADNVDNLLGVILASKKLKELIEGTKPVNGEYLPVKILNHKRRVASADYFIVNQVGLLDCINLKKSKVVWNAIEPEMISSCLRLVIDESRIEREVTLFRPKHLPTLVLVHRSLADHLARSGATGLRFVEIKDYPE